MHLLAASSFVGFVSAVRYGFAETLLPLAQTIKNVVTHRNLGQFPVDMSELFLVEAVLSLKADCWDLGARERWAVVAGDAGAGKRAEMENWIQLLDEHRSNTNSGLPTGRATDGQSDRSSDGNNGLPKPSPALSWMLDDRVGQCAIVGRSGRTGRYPGCWTIGLCWTIELRRCPGCWTIG